MKVRRIAQAPGAEVRYRPPTMPTCTSLRRRVPSCVPWALLFAAAAAAAGEPASPAPTAAQAAGVAPAAAPPASEALPPARPQPAPAPPPKAPETIAPEEVPLPSPAPVPIGFLLAWKPSILSVRVDAGQGAKFGSDKVQPLRLMASYTRSLDELAPFVGRIEVEGGQFSTDDEGSGPGLFAGSTGAEWIGRLTVGASTKVFSGFNILGSIGFFSRYQWGRASGGAPTLGVFGAVASSELQFRVAPVLTVVLFGEVALAPFPYWAESRLGDLSDCSEIKGRLQLSLDLTQDFAIDLGFELARWHLAFTRSTILSTDNPPTPQALLIGARQFQLTLGARWKK